MTRIAYLVNQYPKLSHTFVRREIQALERLGLEVERLSIRRANETLRNASDRAESERTRVVLDAGATGLAVGTLRRAVRRPLAFARALAAAISLGFGSQRGLPVHLVYLAEACVVCGILEKAGVSHVHAHFGTNAATVAHLVRMLGGPGYSFTVHGPEEFDHPADLGLPAKIRDAHFVVGVSEYGRSQLMRWSDPVDWPKLQVVHCGVDAALLSEPRTPVPDSNRVVCIGRLCVEKGQHILVEAASTLATRGVDVEIRIGGDGPLRPHLEERIAALGLEDRVHLLGPLGESEVRDETLAARAFVLPSFAEGLPVVLMEALVRHRPVITTPIAGIPELVEDGACGWLVPAGSVDALADALESALRADPAALSELGDIGAQRAAAAHDVDREAEKLARCLRDATAAGA